MYLLAIPMTFLGAMGAYFFKKASVQETNIRTLLGSKELYLGGLLYVISAVMNILLLRYLQYSILYPMTAITYIWTVIVSHNLLGEKISKKMKNGQKLIMQKKQLFCALILKLILDRKQWKKGLIQIQNILNGNGY